MRFYFALIVSILGYVATLLTFILTKLHEIAALL